LKICQSVVVRKNAVSKIPRTCWKSARSQNIIVHVMEKNSFPWKTQKWNIWKVHVCIYIYTCYTIYRRSCHFIASSFILYVVIQIQFILYYILLFIVCYIILHYIVLHYYILLYYFSLWNEMILHFIFHNIYQ
jgi:hypothetical protein